MITSSAARRKSLKNVENHEGTKITKEGRRGRGADQCSVPLNRIFSCPSCLRGSSSSGLAALVINAECVGGWQRAYRATPPAGQSSRRCASSGRAHPPRHPDVTPVRDSLTLHPGSNADARAGALRFRVPVQRAGAAADLGQMSRKSSRQGSDVAPCRRSRSRATLRAVQQRTNADSFSFVVHPARAANVAGGRRAESGSLSDI